jgi:hypothetical protein
MRKRGQANISMGRTLDKTTAPVFATRTQTIDSRSNNNEDENTEDITVLATRQMECHNCDKLGHTMPNCFEYQDMDIEARWARAEAIPVCTCCLKKGHKKETCRLKDKGRAICLICRGPHNTLLHRDGAHTKETQAPAQAQAQAQAAVDNSKAIEETIKKLVKDELEKAKANVTVENNVEFESHERCYSTNLRKVPYHLRKVQFRSVPVRVSGNREMKGAIERNMASDEHSLSSFIDPTTAKELNLTGVAREQTIEVMGGHVHTQQSMKTTWFVQAIGKDEVFQVDGNVWAIPDGLGPGNPDDFKAEFPFMKDIPFHNAINKNVAHILLGTNKFPLFRSLKDYPCEMDEPLVRETYFGNTITFHPQGCEIRPKVLYINENDPTESIMSLTEEGMDHDEFCRIVRSSWELDKSFMRHQRPRHNLSESHALNLIKNSTKRLKSGAIEMGIPWKTTDTKLPCNQGYVKRQMKAMEASIKDPKVLKELDKEMQCCIDNNFIEPVSKKDEDSGNGFYMVWFPVVKMAKGKRSELYTIVHKNLDYKKSPSTT